MLPSNKVLHYFDHTPYAGVFSSTVSGVITVQEGDEDTIQLQLLINKERIQDACFKAYGGCATIACASYLCEQLIGKTKEQAMDIKFVQVIEKLALNEQERYAACLAENVLHQALDKWL